MNAAEARAWVATNRLAEVVETVATTAPPLPAEVADIWRQAAHERHVVASAHSAPVNDK